MFSFPFQSFQLFASKAETIPMLLTFIMPKSTQLWVLPSHAWGFLFPWEGTLSRFGLWAVCREKGLECGWCETQRSSLRAELPKQRHILSALASLSRATTQATLFLSLLGKRCSSLSHFLGWGKGWVKLARHVTCHPHCPSSPKSASYPHGPISAKTYSPLQIPSKTVTYPQPSPLCFIPRGVSPTPQATQSCQDPAGRAYISDLPIPNPFFKTKQNKKGLDETQ